MKICNNKLTYIMIPENHPVYPFPLNLEDRVVYIKKKINKIVERDIDFKVSKKKDSYEITFKNEKVISSNSEIKDIIEKLGAKLNGNNWVLELN